LIGSLVLVVLVVLIVLVVVINIGIIEFIDAVDSIDINVVIRIVHVGYTVMNMTAIITVLVGNGQVICVAVAGDMFFWCLKIIT
jgi:hypothetical protein